MAASVQPLVSVLIQGPRDNLWVASDAGHDDERLMMRVFRVAVLLALLLAACGQTAETGTTTATTIEPEVATTTTDTDTQVVSSLDDVPQECIDAFVTYLRAIEPVIQDIDFDTLTGADFEAFGTELEPATEAFEQASAETGCDDINLDMSDEESFNVIIDLAQRDAPGTVAYFEWIRDFSASMEDAGSGTGSGDCETDIAAFQAIVDQGGTISDLPVTETGPIYGLITSISTVCSVERVGEFFAQADVAAFLETGG